MIDGVNYSYPTTYGLSGCQAYDNGLSPYCGNSSDSPGWCADAWCWVSPSECHGVAYTNGSSYFTYASGLENLAYSYGQCGDSNAFTDFYYVPPPPPAPSSVDCPCLTSFPVRGPRLHARGGWRRPMPMLPRFTCVHGVPC